ncbi:MAG: nitrilase [Betaproteobacteria bacterium RIFCSPLOWO2_02_64_14]|nr:MAG: nitrilase [Betaproteobacteria bacterium RIFCSPLOWO2_02_64_14]
MTAYTEFTLAAIQAAPVYFDREASTEKACRLIEEAAQNGATLAAFSETWLPGYPFFREVKTSSLRRQADAAYLANAVKIPSPTTDRLCAAAQRANIDVAIGVVELDARTHGTVYCTLLFIGCDGKILGRHRKLKPTYGERTIWGEGDGLGLTVYERPYGRVSGLNCWEHMMLLPGYALMAQGTQIHVATWPTCAVSTNHLLSQAFAIQGGCYVIAVGALRSPEDVPEKFRPLLMGEERPKSRSCIIAPGGNVLAEAAAGEEAIVVAHGSLEEVLMAKARCDVGGHYSRPDVLQLLVHGQPLERIIQPEPVGTATRAASWAPAVRPFAIAASTPDNGQETHQTDEHTAVR